MKCIIKINDAHELRKQCQQSDTRLRELYGKLKKEYDIDRCKVTKVSICIYIEKKNEYKIITI